MKYLITKITDKTNIQNIEEYSQLTLKKLKQLCETYGINYYHGITIDRLFPPHAELMNTNNRKFTIHLAFENITEAKIVEVSLKHLLDLYVPIPTKSNSTPLKTSTIKVNQNTRLVLKSLKQKGESYDDVISRLMLGCFSEYDF